MNTRPLFLTLVLALAPLLASGAEKDLVVHEWGTFTSLQDEAGDPVGGINTDDEPVPQFVRRIADGAFEGFLLSRGEMPPAFFQGAPHCHPDVTMRLETPVLYFYPAAGGATQPIDVRVAFRGGWLTEFYPAAEAKAPGFDADNPDLAFPIDKGADTREFRHGFGHLRPDADGELWWKGVTMRVDGAGPETDANVWLAPRAVHSAMLQTAFGEREKFLFYRGVGSARAALRVVRDEAHQILEIRDDTAALPGSSQTVIPAAWLVDVEEDGRCAFRSLGVLKASTPPRAVLPASFRPDEFSLQHLARLKREMRAALVAAGLFADEAEALLRTWEISYFKSPGLRLFYLCPANEIERLLPLHISVPCDLTRVLIGRIEIVTPRQRAILAKIAASEASGISTKWGPWHEFVQNRENQRRWWEVADGKAHFRDLAFPIPANYSAYLQLGRFRNALLLDEEKRRPTPALRDFVRQNQFQAYQIR